MTIAIDDCYDVWGSGIISIPWNFSMQELKPQLLKLLGPASVQPDVLPSGDRTDTIALSTSTGRLDCTRPLILGTLGQYTRNHGLSRFDASRQYSYQAMQYQVQQHVRGCEVCFWRVYTCHSEQSKNRAARAQTTCKAPGRQTSGRHTHARLSPALFPCKALIVSRHQVCGT
jgi:hypothetical protein